MRITKMHGLENDFVVVDEPFDFDAGLVRLVCHRRVGVGADGLLAVGTDNGTITMRYWNADGSTAEMCGNGLRCVARYAVDRFGTDSGLTIGEPFVVSTPVGVRRAIVGAHEVEVELGATVVGESVEIGGHRYQTVSVGNPHAVAMVDDPDTVDVPGIGSLVERNPHFPQGTNVEFWAPTAEGGLRMRVWERGVGETRACGTGMVAAAAVASGRRPGVRIPVQVQGGTGYVRFDDDTAWLLGPAVTVFETEFDPVSVDLAED